MSTGLNFVYDGWQFAYNRSPYDEEVNIGVFVDQKITHADYLCPG